MANALIQAAIASAKFARRRRSHEKPEIETILVDVDRTLTAEDSPKLALSKLAGSGEAKRIFDSFPAKVVCGKLKIQDIHGAVYRELYSRGFKRADWPLIMEELERNGGIKRRLIDCLLELGRTHGLTLVLATRASRDGAEWLAKRYGFHHAVGSVEHINGSFSGFETMIGASDNGNGIMTKLTAARKEMALSGKPLEPSKTAVIANDLLDALEMLSCARGIVVLPSSPNRLELLTARLRLYDVLLREERAPAELPAALGF